jgi:hypothetical protein
VRVQSFSCIGSLDRLKIDHLDVFFLHTPASGSVFRHAGEPLDTMEGAVRDALLGACRA